MPPLLLVGLFGGFVSRHRLCSFVFAFVFVRSAGGRSDHSESASPSTPPPPPPARSQRPTSATSSRVSLYLGSNPLAFVCVCDFYRAARQSPHTYYSAPNWPVPCCKIQEFEPKCATLSLSLPRPQLRPTDRPTPVPDLTNPEQPPTN